MHLGAPLNFNMLTFLILTTLSTSSANYLPKCATDFYLDDSLNVSWSLSGDTLITQFDTLILNGLFTHTHENLLAFVGLKEESWVAGLVRSGKIKFVRNFKQIPDELSPLVRVSSNGLLLIFPSRTLVYNIDSTGETKSIAGISLFDEKKQFLYEITFEALPVEGSESIWVVAGTEKGVLIRLTREIGSKTYEKKLDDLYLNSVSVVKDVLLLSVFSVSEGVPGNYRLLSFSKNGALWSISSSSVVKLSGSVGKYQLARIGDLWQLIDAETAEAYLVFPEIPKKSRTWVIGTEKNIVVAWSPLPSLTPTCYIITDTSGGSRELRCIDETPALNPLQVINGKVYLKTCSRFLELR